MLDRDSRGLHLRRVNHLEDHPDAHAEFHRSRYASRRSGFRSEHHATPRFTPRLALPPPRTIKTALETAHRTWSTKGKAGARTYSIAKWALVDLTRIARPDLFLLRHEVRIAGMSMSDVKDFDIRETICYWRDLGYGAKLIERRLLAFRTMGFKITDKHFWLAFNRMPFGRAAPAESASAESCH